jgi:NADH-quinone oxidoreductase subunit N
VTSFPTLVDNLIRDTLEVSLPAFGPELVLCGTIVLMLLVRVFRVGQKIDSSLIALAGAVIALYLAAVPATSEWTMENVQSTPIFTGLLVNDAFAVFFRCLLMLFAVLFVIFTKITGIPDREDAADFYTLVLGATIGFCLMVSANHLLTVFLAIEMASVPSYVLAGMLKGRRESSEAALKYAVYGAGAAGVMLYGISLLAGSLGTAHIPSMAVALAEGLQSGALSDRYMVLALGGLMLMVGLAFKLSAVPFHFWCPDVFEGACAEVNAFLSVASKAAALGLLVRVALGVAYLPASAETEMTAPPAAITVTQQAEETPDSSATSLMNIDDHHAKAAPEKTPTGKADNAALSPVREFVYKLIAFLAMITCTFGNLAAYAQTNLKRLMAYSTIAHAGYMMMAVAAAVYLAGVDPAAAGEAIAAMAFYMVIYLFMNLGAFAVIAFMRSPKLGEEISDYAGLIHRCPGLVICFGAILISLLGLPPLAGFWGKVLVFGSLVRADTPWLWTLLFVGGINSVISLYYYLRVVKTMTIDPEPEDRLPVEFSLVSIPGAFLVVVTLPVFVLGIWWDGLYQWALQATASLLG